MQVTILLVARDGKQKYRTEPYVGGGRPMAEMYMGYVQVSRAQTKNQLNM